MSLKTALGRLVKWFMAITRRGHAQGAQPQPHENAAEVSRMLGLALQGQGQLDLAFQQFRRATPGDVVMRDLRGLALDFERKQQFGQAGEVLRYIASFTPEAQQDQERLKKMETLPGHDRSSSAMLGRYQLGKELGKGAMGVVYLGRDTQSGRAVAIKTMALSEEFEGRDLLDARERFFREAETAGRLQHLNIVTIDGCGEEGELAFIAMEFLKGADLAGYCKQGHLLPVPQVISIVARVAQALAYAHRHHVVHRDIKPANIMFDPEDDTVKVTDFGIARITDSSKTKTGLVFGTPSFMSPEQLAGKKVDGRSDLYSLGVMLFQMLTGVLPFTGKSMADLMHKIAILEAPDIGLIRQDLPPSLVRLVAKALRKRPEDRYQDGDQLARELRAVLSGASTIDLEI